MPIDPVSPAPNRLILTSWRSILNTWAATINKLITNDETNATDIAALEADVATNTSNIATNTSNIATNTSAIAANTSDIATNTADILLKQTATSKSTLLMGYRARATSDTLAAGDVNSIVHMTNTGACTFTISLGILNNFTVGQYFIIANDGTSTNIISVSATGGATLNGTPDIAIGTSGLYVKITGTVVLRIY